MNQPEPLHPVDDAAEDQFVEEIRAGLKRVPAPPNFASSVMARLAAEPPATTAKLLSWPRARQSVAAWGALAATLLLGAGGVGEWQHQRTLARQAAAERQFAVAMQATGHALQLTQKQLSRAGVRLAD